MDISNIFRRAKDPGDRLRMSGQPDFNGCDPDCVLIQPVVAENLSTLDFMALPGMMYFIIDRYIPMLGITIAFKKVDYSLGVWDSPWVGLENFKMLFSHRGKYF